MSIVIINASFYIANVFNFCVC